MSRQILPGLAGHELRREYGDLQQRAEERDNAQYDYKNAEFPALLAAMDEYAENYAILAFLQSDDEIVREFEWKKNRAMVEVLANVLGGHRKTGHAWTSENRPCGVAQDKCCFTLPK